MWPLEKPQYYHPPCSFTKATIFFSVEYTKENYKQLGLFLKYLNIKGFLKHGLESLWAAWVLLGLPTDFLLSLRLCPAHVPACLPARPSCADLWPLCQPNSNSMPPPRVPTQWIYNKPFPKTLHLCTTEFILRILKTRTRKHWCTLALVTFTFQNSNSLRKTDILEDAPVFPCHFWGVGWDAEGDWVGAATF